jgi:hypothetical protein
VKYGIDGEETPLTNRAQDFWKAIDVWLDLIITDCDKKRTKEEQVRYINTHKFHYFKWQYFCKMFNVFTLSTSFGVEMVF